MAQSALTVTPPNPTPPTNMSFLGTTPPTSPSQPTADDGTAQALTAFAVKTASVDNVLFPSVEHEGRGTEVVVTKVAGSGPTDYNPNTFLPLGTSQMITVSDLGTYTTNPNAQHASSLSPAVNPTLTSIASVAAGTGNGTCAATGTGFTKQSVLWVNGIAYPTTFTSATAISCTAPKRATPGQTWPVKVVTGGVVETATVNWTFT
jgi:hypothetical protein